MKGKEVLLGVTGGIAAYKSCELARILVQRGANVTVVMTGSAARFVTPLTFSALTGRPAKTELFDADGSISHIELAQKADAVVVAPATADIIAKMASGIADDLLSTLLTVSGPPVVMAPSMNCRMYGSPAVKRNLKILAADGVVFAGPEEGPMACGEHGWGRMSDPVDIADKLESALAGGDALKGKTVLVSAGPTFEDIDPVRFVGNRSSGKMGYAIAGAAARMGAKVDLVSGPVSLLPPAGVNTVRVRSAAEMDEAVSSLAKDADVVIMAAAVSDYRPEKTSAVKIKKGAGGLELKLVKTADILKKLGRDKKKGCVLVGFAAETEDLEKNAIKKLNEKKLDIIAANPVGNGQGFESDFNALRIYAKEGLIADTGLVSKAEAARTLIDIIAGRAGVKKPRRVDV